MKCNFFILFFLIVISIYSQSEIDIIGVKYSSTTKNNYYKNQYKSNTNKLDVFVNYGHHLGENTKLFYHASYHNFNLNTTINSDKNRFSNTTYNKAVPNYSFVNLAAGITTNFKNKWSLTHIFSMTFSDDFNNDLLKSHHYFRSFSYLKKKRTVNFSYGFGIYFSKLNSNLRVLPILSLELKNNQRGLKLFLPRELKFWQKINTKSYIALKTILNSNYLKFNDGLLDIELLSINSTLTYNYIYKNKFKFKTGIGLPYTEYEYKIGANSYKTNLLNFSIIGGINFIVFK